MICFIILHYNTIKETRNCVSSIMALEHADNSRVVIVDNASSNQTVWCMRNHKKIVYNPDIVVYHMEGKATESVDAQEKDRVRFRMHNILQAARAYKEFISSGV